MAHHSLPHDRHGLPALPDDYAAYLLNPHRDCPCCDGQSGWWDPWGGEICPVGYSGFPPAALAEHAAKAVAR